MYTSKDIKVKNRITQGVSNPKLSQTGNEQEWEVGRMNCVNSQANHGLRIAYQTISFVKVINGNSNK